jgi:hypothetical protein
MDDGYALVGQPRLPVPRLPTRGTSQRLGPALERRSVGEGNWTGGVRGRVSDRGGGIRRNDFGAYGAYRLRRDF